MITHYHYIQSQTTPHQCQLTRWCRTCQGVRAGPDCQRTPSRHNSSRGRVSSDALAWASCLSHKWCLKSLEHIAHVKNLLLIFNRHIKTPLFNLYGLMIKDFIKYWALDLIVISRFNHRSIKLLLPIDHPSNIKTKCRIVLPIHSSCPQRKSGVSLI